jgi:ferredoxin-NADP reductase
MRCLRLTLLLVYMSGIGLTPFMCMLQHHLSLPLPARRPIILLHADKSQDSLAFAPFLLEQVRRVTDTHAAIDRSIAPHIPRDADKWS